MKKILTLLLGSLLLLSPLVQADGIFGNKQFDFLKSEPELMPVDQAFAFDFSQQGNKVKLSWVIADGYYMYRDKLKFSIDGGELGEIALPQGKGHTDEYFGEQQVYYSFIEIPLAIKEAGEAAKLSVTFMGCAEGKLCFPPTTRDALLKPVAANDGILPDADKAADSQAAPKGQAVTQQDNLLDKLLSGDSTLLNYLTFFVLGIGLALTPVYSPCIPFYRGSLSARAESLYR